MSDKAISMAVVRRLPKYHRYLYDMMKAGEKRTSSRELSEIIGFSASQIRQDLNNFGEFGQQGYGYNVEDLYNEISKIIGLDKKYNMVIVGAGNLGQAIIKFGFDKIGFEIKGALDNDEKKIGKKFGGVEVIDVDILETYLSKNKIDIAALCVPHDVAQNLADRLFISGVRSIWNFTPIDLVVPDDLVVENVHLVDSLMTIAYLLNG